MPHRTQPPARTPDLQPLPCDRRPPARGQALLACAAVLGAASAAHGGVTLLSRQTALRATGGSVGSAGGGPGGIDDAASLATFDRFADTVGSDAGLGGVIASAQQYSVPGCNSPDGGGLQGAFGEGSVRSSVLSGGGVANATSDLDLVFRVDGAPASYMLGGSLGTTGGGSAMVHLIPMSVGRDAPVYAADLSRDFGDAADGTLSLDHTGDLAPGDYMLRVQAGASDTSAVGPEGTAYYSFTFMVSDAAPPAAAVPLPPAVLMGGAAMGLLAGARITRRARKARAAA